MRATQTPGATHVERLRPRRVPDVPRTGADVQRMHRAGPRRGREPRHTEAVGRGHDILHEGDAGEEFFVLAPGDAIVRRGGDVVATLDAGAYFGELALFDPAPRNATGTATSPATTIGLSRDAFRQVLGDSLAIREALLRGMARRLHEVDGKERRGKRCPSVTTTLANSAPRARIGLPGVARTPPL